MHCFYTRCILFVRVFILLIFSTVFSHILFAQPTLELTEVISGLNSPMQLVHAGDGKNKIFIVQKGGTIAVFGSAPSYTSLGTFLTVSGLSTAGERGLLSLAFHPQYATNGFFFVYYTNTAGDLEVARYKVSADENVADASSKVVVLTIPHPGQSNHNGGELHFGTDGFLYLSTGDGGGGGDVMNNAQNTGVLLGKILRLAVNTSPTAPYYVPAPGNPFSNEIYALGLRNPFRWSFDKQTQDIWIGDVGQDSWEEVNYVRADSIIGVNFGWRCYEGNANYNTAGCTPPENYVSPVYTYATPNPSGAITGGVVYRGAGSTSMQGYYISADFYTGNFYKTIKIGNVWNTVTQAGLLSGVSDFGETEDGQLYAVSLTSNNVSHITASDLALPVTLVQFAGELKNGVTDLKWKTASEENVREFIIEYSTNGSVFNIAGSVTAKNAANGADYTFSHPIADKGTIFYRLKMVDRDGAYKYSPVVTVSQNSTTASFISPTVINNGMLNIFLNDAFNSMELVNINGSTVQKQNITGLKGKINIPIAAVAGVYVVRLIGSSKVITQRILIQ